MHGQKVDRFKDRLRHRAGVTTALDCLLEEALVLTGAELGNAQLMNWKNGCLEIVAQRGFGAEFLNAFRRVKLADATACARTLHNHDAIVVEDVAADPNFLPWRGVMRRAGVAAVQSTPIVSSSGAFVGVVSTHFTHPHTPAGRQMAALNKAAQMTANAVIMLRVRERDWSSEDSQVLLFESRKALEQAAQLFPHGYSAKIGGQE